MKGLLDEIVRLVNEGVNKIFSTSYPNIPPRDNRDAGKFGERIAKLLKGSHLQSSQER